MLELFLLKIFKEHTLTRSTILVSRNHIVFLINKRISADANTEQLLHQTDKNSHRRCSIKKAVHKDFAIFTWEHQCWSLCLIKLPVFRPANLLEIDSKTGVFLLGHFKKIYFEECFWTDFRKQLFRTLFLESRFQSHCDSVILQKYKSPSN